MLSIAGGLASFESFWIVQKKKVQQLYNKISGFWLILLVNLVIFKYHLIESFFFVIFYFCGFFLFCSHCPCGQLWWEKLITRSLKQTCGHGLSVWGLNFSVFVFAFAFEAMFIVFLLNVFEIHLIHVINERSFGIGIILQSSWKFSLWSSPPNQCFVMYLYVANNFCVANNCNQREKDDKRPISKWRHPHVQIF